MRAHVSVRSTCTESCLTSKTLRAAKEGGSCFLSKEEGCPKPLSCSVLRRWPLFVDEEHAHVPTLTLPYDHGLSLQRWRSSRTNFVVILSCSNGKLQL